MERSISTSKSECSSGVTDERRRRKRIQNRLNQRAFRARNALEKEIANAKANKRQYKIDRWRLDEDQDLQSAQASSNSGDRLEAAQYSVDRFCDTTWFPLPADHLLHLIKYNVFRGLCQNKALIEQLAVQYHTADDPTEAFSDHAIFPRYSVIVPASPHLSGYLTPTALQMSVVHSTWINFLPFPAMRENLIKWEFSFDHSELVKDLVGDLINLKIFASASSSSMPALADMQPFTHGVDNDSTATETGLIVWGEPYRADSWEATPEFLQKWAWAVADCQELIESTNRWRRLRGEESICSPLPWSQLHEPPLELSLTEIVC